MSSVKKPSAHIFLMELQVEDIPVRFLRRAKEHWEKSVHSLLAESKLAGSFQVWATPKRLAFQITGLPETTAREEVMVTGPKEDTLKDGQGRWTQRVAAFAKGHNIAPEELRLENGRVAYTKVIAPKKTVEILREKIPSFVFSTPFAKTMRWEGGNHRFARPMRGLIAYWDGRLLRDWRWVPGVVVNPFTWVGRKKVKISKASEYEAKLKSAGLVLDAAKKKEKLLKELEKKTAGFALTRLGGETLLEEMLSLVEIPRVVVGKFDSRFANLPEEVAASILGKVKLILLTGGDGAADRFVSIVENPASDKFLTTIRQGYERVASSKLFDAKFFWDQDLKKPLESYVEKLQGILYAKELGSLWDKVERVRKSASLLASHVPNASPEILERAALLYKADLATSLAGEYPDLAGKVGARYAEAQGENPAVARAILESAAPSASSSPEGIALSLAERFDTLLAQFALGNKPSATEDPLGLKRLADQALEIFWSKRCDCSIRHALDKAWEPFGHSNDPRQDLLEYFRGRLVLLAKNHGYAPDRIEAVLSATRFRDLFVGDIADCLEAFKNLERHQPATVSSMAQSFKRISNIVRQAEKAGSASNGLVDASLFSHPSESDLWKRASASLERFEDSVKRASFESAFEEAAGFAAPLEDFFKGVMVMAEDERVRQNRLALLRQIQRMVLQIMDPSKLVLAEATGGKRETENVKS